MLLLNAGDERYRPGGIGSPGTLHQKDGLIGMTFRGARGVGVLSAGASRGRLAGAIGLGLVLLGLVVGAARASADATSATTTFTYSGQQQTFVVPAGVTTVHVMAVGGTGGPASCFFSPCGGPGAQVTADVAVTPGETLYVEVGQDSTSSAGGWNGGGAGGSGGVIGNVPGGGGGGASDVRTVAASTNDPSADLASLNSRLVVAGGGGGGSFENHGGAAGTAGSAGHAGAAGNPGTTGGGGPGGSCGCVSMDESGKGGALGTGGSGGNATVSGSSCADSNFAGGGGGGGGVGGGGGGAGGDCDEPSSGGGGGASGFASVGVSNAAIMVDATLVPSVTLSWTPPVVVTPPPVVTAPPVVPAPVAVTGPMSGAAARSAALIGSVNPQGVATIYRFQYGTSNPYGRSTAAKSAGAGPTAVTVAAHLTGLHPGALYHYRLVASSAGGTSPGADRTFHTRAVIAITGVSGGACTRSSHTMLRVRVTSFLRASIIVKLDGRRIARARHASLRTPLALSRLGTGRHTIAVTTTSRAGTTTRTLHFAVCAAAPVSRG